jgi:hypothetical protein
MHGVGKQSADLRSPLFELLHNCFPLGRSVGRRGLHGGHSCVGFFLSDYCMLIAHLQGVVCQSEIIGRSLHEVRYAWDFEACDMLQPAINAI